MFGLAQVFSTVSPKMFKEFEVDYTSRICERFGLVYYGCCDPLDNKMNEVRLIPNVRKISMSPWVNQEKGAENIGTEFVFSRKPNPALLATKSFNSEQIYEDLLKTIKICKKYCQGIHSFRLYFLGEWVKYKSLWISSQRFAHRKTYSECFSFYNLRRRLTG